MRRSVRSAIVVLVLHAGVVLGQTAGELDGSFDAGTGPDAAVSCIALQPDGKILAGGSFGHWNTERHAGLVRLLEDGSIDVAFVPNIELAADGGIAAVGVANDGTIYVGGMFVSIDGVSRHALARLRPDGSLDTTFDPKLAGGSIASLVVAADGKVTAGGVFGIDSPIPRVAIARFLSNGDVDGDYGPLFASYVVPFPQIPLVSPEIGAIAIGVDGAVVAASAFYGPLYRFTPTGAPIDTAGQAVDGPVLAVLVQPDGANVIGLELASVNSGRAVQRVSANGTPDAGFSPMFSRSTDGGLFVSSLLLDQAGRITVGGRFAGVDGVARPNLVRLLADGTVDTRFGATAAIDGAVSAIVADAKGRILIGGSFSHAQGANRNGIARLMNPELPPQIRIQPRSITATERRNTKLQVVADAEPGLAYQWYKNGHSIGGATNATLWLVDVQDPATYAASVTNAAGTVTSDEVTVSLAGNTGGALDRNFNPAVTGVIFVGTDGRVYAGDTKLQRLNFDGTIDPNFGITLDTRAFGSVSVRGADILPNGDFLLQLSDRPNVYSLARYHPDGTWDNHFRVDGVQSHVVLPNGAIVVGGVFDANPPIRVLRKLLPSGDEDPTFHAPSFAAASWIATLAVDADGKIVAIGQFSDRPGDYATSARFRADGSRDSSWNPGWSSNDQLMPDGSLLRVGDRLGGHIRRMRADGTDDPTFNCTIQSSSGHNVVGETSVTIRPQSDGRLLLQGSFTLVDGQPASRIARIFADGSLDRSFVPPPNPPVGYYDLIGEWGGMIYIGGQFTQIDGEPRPRFARLYRDPVGGSRIVNLSARGLASTEGETLITGFVLAGNGACPVLTRGIGPTLAEFGVLNPIAAGSIELFHGDTKLDANSGWTGADPGIGAVMKQVGAFDLPAESLDAALYRSLPVGGYTVVTRAANGPAGEALAELYSAAPSDAEARLVNLSARAQVGDSGRTLIAGFTVRGNGEKQILVRAIGPALAAFGVPDALPNPRLTLVGPSGVIAANDDWASDAYAGLADEAAHKVGAFPASSLDSVVLRSLPAGNYTAIVESSDGQTGTALVEVYEVTD